MSNLKTLIPTESEKLFIEELSQLNSEEVASSLLRIARDQYHDEFEYWFKLILTEKGAELSFKRLDIWAKIGDACQQIVTSERKIKALIPVLQDVKEELERQTAGL